MGALKSSKCSKGHRLTDATVYLRKNGQRDCKKCSLARANEAARLRKEQRNKAT